MSGNNIGLVNEGRCDTDNDLSCYRKLMFNRWNKPSVIGGSTVVETHQHIRNCRREKVLHLTLQSFYSRRLGRCFWLQPAHFIYKEIKTSWGYSILVFLSGLQKIINPVLYSKNSRAEKSRLFCVEVSMQDREKSVQEVCSGAWVKATEDMAAVHQTSVVHFSY